MMPAPVEITEVGPRDGLQNESRQIATADKITFIQKLAACGLRHIEAVSFVHPKMIPQLADAEDVMRGLNVPQTVSLSALVPNERGLNRALSLPLQKIAVFTAASESFTQKNINCNIADSLKRFDPVVKRAKATGLKVRGYVSTAFYCPYEGQIDPVSALPVIDSLFALGVDEISIGDTIGKANPEDVKRLLDVVLKHHKADRLIMHFHDTFNNAIHNVKASLDHGVFSFDSSAAGLGGCPFAPGAKGNLSTNTLVSFLHENGYQTGVDESGLAEAATFIQERLA